jgi:hypothetical protein
MHPAPLFQGETNSLIEQLNHYTTMFCVVLITSVCIMLGNQ